MTSSGFTVDFGRWLFTSLCKVGHSEWMSLLVYHQPLALGYRPVRTPQSSPELPLLLTWPQHPGQQFWSNRLHSAHGLHQWVPVLVGLPNSILFHPKSSDLGFLPLFHKLHKQGVPVFYCCVKNNSKTQWPTTPTRWFRTPLIYLRSLMVSVGQEYRKGPAERLQPGVSCTCSHTCLESEQQRLKAKGANQASPSFLEVSGPLHVVSPPRLVWASLQHGSLVVVQLLIRWLRASRADIPVSKMEAGQGDGWRGLR